MSWNLVLHNNNNQMVKGYFSRYCRLHKRKDGWSGIQLFTIIYKWESGLGGTFLSQGDHGGNKEKFHWTELCRRFPLFPGVI